MAATLKNDARAANAIMMTGRHKNYSGEMVAAGKNGSWMAFETLKLQGTALHAGRPVSGCLNAGTYADFHPGLICCTPHREEN